MYKRRQIGWDGLVHCSMYGTRGMTKTCEEHIVLLRRNIPLLSLTTAPTKNISIFCPHLRPCRFRSKKVEVFESKLDRKGKNRPPQTASTNAANLYWLTLYIIILRLSLAPLLPSPRQCFLTCQPTTIGAVKIRIDDGKWWKIILWELAFCVEKLGEGKWMEWKENGRSGAAGVFVDGTMVCRSMHMRTYGRQQDPQSSS